MSNDTKKTPLDIATYATAKEGLAGTEPVSVMRPEEVLAVYNEHNDAKEVSATETVKNWLIKYASTRGWNTVSFVGGNAVLTKEALPPPSKLKTGPRNSSGSNKKIGFGDLNTVRKIGY